jgi:hypothetical protein
MGAMIPDQFLLTFRSHIDTHTQVHTQTHTHNHPNTHTHTHTHRSISAHFLITHRYAYTSTHTHTHTRTHTHIHTHIHTHTQDKGGARAAQVVRAQDVLLRALTDLADVGLRGGGRMGEELHDAAMLQVLLGLGVCWWVFVWCGCGGV